MISIQSFMYVPQSPVKEDQAGHNFFCADPVPSDYTPLHGNTALSLSFQLCGLKRAEYAPSGIDQKCGLLGKQKSGQDSWERDTALSTFPLPYIHLTHCY